MANFGWNYPPGVTGREYEIAGPDDEWESEHYCEKCEKTTMFSCESFQKQRSGICSECDSDIDLGHTDDDIDWDAINDQREDHKHFLNERGW
tara:strand:- start:342 stop:617 length:276 start_codon:yes stop_codon:yes gene_type:complete